MRWVDGPILDPIDRLAIENGISGRELIRDRLRQRVGEASDDDLLAWCRDQVAYLAWRQQRAAEDRQRAPVTFGRTADRPEPTASDADADAPDALIEFWVLVALSVALIVILARVLP